MKKRVARIKKALITTISVLIFSVLIINGSVYAGEGGQPGSGGWPGCSSLTYFATCYGAKWQWYPTTSDHVFIDGWTGANRSYAYGGYIDGCAAAGGYWRYAMVIKTDDPPGTHGNQGWLYAGQQVGFIGIGGSDDYYFNSEYLGGGMNYIGDNWYEVEQIYRKLQEYDPVTYWRGWNYYSDLAWFCGPGDITQVKPPVVEYTLTGQAIDIYGNSLRGIISDVSDTVEEGNWASVTRRTKTGYLFKKWVDSNGNLITADATHGEYLTYNKTIYAVYEQQEFSGRARVVSGTSTGDTGFVKSNRTTKIEIDCPNTGCNVDFDLSIKTEKGTGNANFAAYRSISESGAGTQYYTNPSAPYPPSTSGTTLSLLIDYSYANPYREKLLPGQTVCYYLSFAPNGDTAYVATKACAYAKLSTFEGKVKVSTDTDSSVIDWRNTSRVDTFNIKNCPVETGCNVTFRHYLRRTSGIGSTTYTISRTSNYEKKVSSNSNLKSGTETFTSSSVEEYVDSNLNLVPGQVVCETLAFKSNNNQKTPVDNTELKLCASALGDAQPPDPPIPPAMDDDDLSDAFINMLVKNNNGPNKYKKYRESVYAKPDQKVTFRSTYNPILQYTYNIYPQKMRIDSGTVKPDRVNMSKNLGTLFNENKGSSYRNWDNAFTVHTASGFIRAKDYYYTIGDTTKRKEFNDYSVSIDDVGKDLSASATTNLNNDTKTTPSQVTFTSDSSKNNLATVITNSKTSMAHVYVPYNFGTNVEIKTKSTDPIYAGEEKEIKYEVEITPRVNEETTDGTLKYATKVPKSISRIIIYTPKNGVKPGIDEWGTQGENSNICSYYGLSKDDVTCKYDDERTGPLNQGGNVSGELKEYILKLNTPDLPAGTNICVSVAHYPSSSGLPTNWKSIEGSGKWHISDSVCFIIAKRPSFQVWGGSLYSGGSINTSAAQKTTLRDLPKFNGTFVFSSWVEQSVVAKGRAIALASGASTGLADNIAGGGSLENSPDYCKYRVPLSLANYSQSATSLICNSSQSTGNSGIAANLTDRMSLIATLPNEDSIINEYSGTTHIPFNNSTAKDVVRYNVNGAAIVGPVTIAPGRTHIVKASSDVLINGDIIYQENTYSDMSNIPKLIIYGKNITINCNVNRIDAIIIAEEDLNTCASGDTNLRANSRELRVNGAIITNRLFLNRTYGAANGINSKVPAEIVNYDVSTLLWGRAKSDPDNKHKNLTSVYIHELSPRF